MLNKLFPLKLYLHVFQLEGYSSIRFLKWVITNYFVRTIEEKKPLVWTRKAKLLYYLAVCYAFAAFVLLVTSLRLYGLLLGLTLFTQPYTFLLAGLATLKPYEFANRMRVKRLIKKKITKLKQQGLQVIGITGSYGKTTTKEYLYQMLKTKYKVLKTPESYNTLFGIYKVIDLELYEGYDFFICEMGAYCRGEIKELCDVVLPDHGILTGINEQHLERFGSIENIIKAKFELIQAIPENGIKLLNVDNTNIAHNYKSYTAKALFYGKNSPDNYYKNLNYIDGKAVCDFVLSDYSLGTLELSLCGEGNIANALAAASLAAKLGVPTGTVSEVLRLLKPSPHRLELINYPNGTTFVDDAYSSNVDGFKVALNYLSSFTTRPKVLVTPGIVELGRKTEVVHKELGTLANGLCDFVILVGHSSRTEGLALAVAHDKVQFINSIKELPAVLAKLQLELPVVLIENDLPENY